MALSILVVDDDDAIRQVLTRYLKRRGYIVDTAADGQEALAAVRESDPDIMLLDIYLPKMSGLDVLSAIRDDGLHTRTIALSGFPDEQMVRDSRDLGAVAFVPKPFDFPELTAQIDSRCLLR